jgi:hypothetical protein
MVENVTAPRSASPVSKLLGEAAVIHTARARGIPYVTGRFRPHLRARMRADHVIPELLRAMRREDPEWYRTHTGKPTDHDNSPRSSGPKRKSLEIHIRKEGRPAQFELIPALTLTLALKLISAHRCYSWGGRK